MKAALVLLASALLVAFVAAKSESEYENQWNSFIATYEKTYSTIESVHRYNIFKQNVDFIENFNNNGSGKSYQVAINKFADLTNQEFNQMYNGYKMSAKQANPTFVAESSAAPTSWDWRTKGAVTPIKDQGQCGSCWAFSTVGSTEGCHFLTTGKLVSLSEQDLVDCSDSEGNQGCDGGLMDDGFQYIIDNKGIDTETCYPYNAVDGTCHYSKSCCGSTVTSFSDVTSGSESALLTAVYSAPTSVAIDASQSSFQFYSGGVYYEPACSSQQLDHGVLAVGYGTSGSSAYWIVKNSWGTSWGLKGYILMSRNKNNNCGIATMASLPHGCGACK
jgi:cathepsin L